MKSIRTITLSIFILLSFSSGFSQNMDNEALGKIINAVADSVEGQSGGWEFSIRGLPMICITDQNNNRMRIISPVIEVKDLTPEQLKSCMEANFHSALDVKYALSSDILWVAFIHPLKELSEDQVLSAISQVFNAHMTFGTTYSSTELVFPAPQAEDEEEKKEEEKPKKKSDKKTKKS